MNPPKWPDFMLTRGKMEDGRIVWRAHTDTGRPGTPIFSMYALCDAWVAEDDVRFMLRLRLDEAFRKAHPNGCPGHHGLG